MANSLDNSKKDLRPEENMSCFFHNLSKDIGMGGQVKVPLDTSLWPEDWKKVSYKKCESTTKISLPLVQEINADISLLEVLKKRTSNRDFKSGQYLVSIDDLSSLLAHSIQIKSLVDQAPGRLYPSPGGMYPCEIYIYVSRGKDIDRGFYHYNFLEKSLELVTSLGEEEVVLDVQRFSTEASFAVVITMVTSRVLPKYGERGYRYGLIEAGHIGQNICLAATALSLKHCPCGGIYEAQMEKYLQIDGKNEVAVYAIYIG
jgi:SagB-type dehydrogenase family enzyme